MQEKRITVSLIEKDWEYFLYWMNADFKNPNKDGSHNVKVTQYPISKTIYDSLYLLED